MGGKTEAAGADGLGRDGPRYTDHTDEQTKESADVKYGKEHIESKWKERRVESFHLTSRRYYGVVVAGKATAPRIGETICRTDHYRYYEHRSVRTEYGLI